MTASPSEAIVDKDPFARLKGELNQLEATARRRLKGSKFGDLVDRVPDLVQAEVDGLLDRAGLVRKAKAFAAPVAATAVDGDAALAGAARADVDVSADVVAEVSAAAVDVVDAADAPVVDRAPAAPAKKKR